MKINEIEKIAKDVLKETGQHSPQLMIETDKRLEIHVLQFRDRKEKEKMCKLYREMINIRKIKSYFVVMEAWMGQNIYKMPSEDKKHSKECLIVQEFNSDLKHKMIVNIFHKKNKKIIFDKRKILDYKKLKDFNSPWNFYLEDSIEEHMSKARIDDFYKRLGGEKKFDDMLDKAEKEFGQKFKINRDMIKDKMLEMIKEGRVIPKEVDGVKNDNRK